jgi:hypothetical protein
MGNPSFASMAMQKGTKLAKLETQKTQDSKQTCK